MTIALADINRTTMDYDAACQLQFCSIQRLLKTNWANLNNKLMIQHLHCDFITMPHALVQ